MNAQVANKDLKVMTAKQKVCAVSGKKRLWRKS